MVGGEKRPGERAAAAPSSRPERLTYIVEIWNLRRTAVERVIARAELLSIARAIFDNAAAANPSRRVVLRKGEQIVIERT